MHKSNLRARSLLKGILACIELNYFRIKQASIAFVGCNAALLVLADRAVRCFVSILLTVSTVRRNIITCARGCSRSAKSIHRVVCHHLLAPCS